MAQEELNLCSVSVVFFFCLCFCSLISAVLRECYLTVTTNLQNALEGYDLFASHHLLMQPIHIASIHDQIPLIKVGWKHVWYLADYTGTCILMSICN